MTWQVALYYVVAIAGAVNLLRLIFMVSATNVHDFNEGMSHRKSKSKKIQPVKRPWITVIVPAYNEELTVTTTLDSILMSNYRYFDVIVVNDGSKDNTAKVVSTYIKNTKFGYKIKLLNQVNGGKASALNNAVAHSKGSLVMCLDADSTIDAYALKNTVRHFIEHPEIIAMPSNVSVRSLKGFLIISQCYEYFLSYRLKRGLSLLGIEYIVGGVGSTFRKAVLKKIGGYDTNTITEDIDLTLKVLAYAGSKSKPIRYGYDVHSYTQGVRGFKDLVKQRYRWKYGRMQAFLKHKSLFFNMSARHRKTLTFYQLPYAVFGEIVLLVEPILVLGVIAVALLNANPASLFVMFFFILAYVIGSVMADTRFKRARDRWHMVLLSPVAFLGFYILTIVELLALLKCVRKLPGLKASLKIKDATWEHVDRYKTQVV